MKQSRFTMVVEDDQSTMFNQGLNACHVLALAWIQNEVRRSKGRPFSGGFTFIMEVTNVGRTLAKEILRDLEQNGWIKATGQTVERRKTYTTRKRSDSDLQVVESNGKGSESDLLEGRNPTSLPGGQEEEETKKGNTKEAQPVGARRGPGGAPSSKEEVQRSLATAITPTRSPHVNAIPITITKEEREAQQLANLAANKAYRLMAAAKDANKNKRLTA